MITQLLVHLLWLPFLFQNANQMSPEERAKLEAQNAELQTILKAAKKLPLEAAGIRSPLRSRDWSRGSRRTKRA